MPRPCQHLKTIVWFSISGMVCLVLAGPIGCHDSSATPTTSVGDVLWRATPGISEPYEWWGMPTVSGSRVFMDVGNSIKAFDTNSGKELWSTVIRSIPEPKSTNLIAKNGMVIAADRAAVVALDEASGLVRWKAVPNDSTIQSYGAADAQTYYIGTRGGDVFALDITTGTTVWQTTLAKGEWIGSNVIGVAISGDTLAVSGVFRNDPLNFVPQAFTVTLDRRNGHELWRFETDTGKHGIYSAPAITDELVLVPDVLQRKVIALERTNGTVRWTISTDPNWGGPGNQPFVRNGVVYFGAHDSFVYAADLKTGTLKWKTRIGSTVDHVVVCGDYVFASNQGGTILNPRNGHLIREVVAGTQDFLTSEWAISNDRIFASGMVAVYALSCE